MGLGINSKITNFIKVSHVLDYKVKLFYKKLQDVFFLKILVLRVKHQDFSVYTICNNLFMIISDQCKQKTKEKGKYENTD